MCWLPHLPQSYQEQQIVAIVSLDLTVTLNNRGLGVLHQSGL